MTNLALIQPVDYLIIGHLTQDLTPQGPVTGGTAAYAALTARRMGLRVGVITAYPTDIPLPDLDGAQIVSIPSDHPTTFENIQTPEGRIQWLHHLAPSLTLDAVPITWRTPAVVHLGPVAQEVDPSLAQAFPKAMIGATPQGWMRSWDEHGQIHYTHWEKAIHTLKPCTCAVISIEDVLRDETVIEEIQSSIDILVVTEGVKGARLYWNSDLRYFRPPVVQEVDPTGAGDIFATAFFIRYQQTRDPWEAARFATHLAALSVTRRGLHSIPTLEEIQTNLIEVV